MILWHIVASLYILIDLRRKIERKLSKRNLRNHVGLPIRFPIQIRCIYFVACHQEALLLVFITRFPTISSMSNLYVNKKDLFTALLYDLSMHATSYNHIYNIHLLLPLHTERITQVWLSHIDKHCTDKQLLILYNI